MTRPWGSCSIGTRDVFLITPCASFWLYVVVRNVCISRLRRKKFLTLFWFSKKDNEQLGEWQVEDAKDLPREEMIETERAKMVRAAISQLQGLQKEALILREYEHLSYAEIADILDRTVDNIKVLIFRAREHLREVCGAALRSLLMT